MEKIVGKAVWRGPEVDYRAEMMHAFTADEVAEIDAALRHCGERDIPEITRETFPLPGLGPEMLRLRDELLDGRGVVLMRGFPRERYTADEMARIYVGLGAHFGQPVAQSWQGQLLGSVIDISDVVEKVRGYNAGGGQNFHIDGSACDIVALMCLRSAKSGGASRIVSVAALHNAMLETRPDLLEVLYRGYYHRNHEMDARHSLFPEQSDHRLPFLTQRDGRVTCLASGCIRYAVQYGDVTMSPLEVEAYDEWQRLARSEEFFLDMNFEEGDIQFLNNRSIMHARNDYEDFPEVARRRHLLRLWLRVPEWPAREPNQIFMNEVDCAHWQATNRRPFMELPSRYLAELTATQQRRVNEGTVLPTEVTSGKFPSARGWQEARERAKGAA
ncbi:MAG: TauD/TfdA family dioxygenase [Alphaproteobacteria bacterium]|nr:TauD/TfdA family dioxygenase [Alphaproteobacteria bacterium]